jgi:hypothetical protein
MLLENANELFLLAASHGHSLGLNDLADALYESGYLDEAELHSPRLHSGREEIR